jgi:lia operon protein LiaG
MNHHVATLALAGLALAAPAALEAQERYTLNGPSVAIYNIAGEVRVEAGDGPGVRVEVRRGGPDAGRLQIAAGPVDGGETLRIVYPGDQVVYPAMGRGSNTTLRVAADGTFGRRGSGRQVRVQGSGRGTEAHADLVVRVPSGARLVLHHAVGSVEVANVDADLRLDTHSARVTTAGTRGSLSVDVGSGAVRVSDAQGRVSIDTGSGSVQVHGIRATELSVDVGSGSVTGSDIQANRVSVDTGSGRVRLTGLAMTEGKVDTGSGGVELELTRPVRSLVVDTGSGGVRLAVPRSYAGELRIDTGSGGINVDLPLASSQRGRSSFRGQVGQGDGRIRVSTGSGGVRVYGS